MKQLILHFKNFIGFGIGHERSNKAKRNITASLLIKGLNIAIGLIILPLTLNYIEPTRYGIWITLSSIVGWFGFFDIGLGHGLRNRFTEAIAKGEHKLAQIYVSTTYAILSLIIGIVLVLFIIANRFINWNAILNADVNIVKSSELSLLALIVFVFFCLSFVLKLITTILTADQSPALASLFDFIGKAIGLFVILILTKVTKGNLIYLGLALNSTPVLVLILSSLWFYSGKYKRYRPQLRDVDFSKSRNLLNLGIKFFIIQISVVLLYQTNNIIISQLFGPEQVTPYNIAFRYFSVLMMGFSIIVTPFWSAFTDAWSRKDINWIKNVMKKLNLMWLILFILAIIMLAISKWVYTIWIGDKVYISFSISILVAIWNLIIAWNSIYCQFLNGVGKVKLQLYIGVFAALINIPLAFFLGKIYGIEGVLLSNILLSLLTIFIYPVQYSKIIRGTASGIFNY